jgi:hypothetical protein
LTTGRAGAPIPQPTLDRLTELFGVKPAFLANEED